MHTDTGLIHNENAVEKDHVRRGSSSRNCCVSIGGWGEMFNTDFQGFFFGIHEEDSLSWMFAAAARNHA